MITENNNFLIPYDKKILKYHYFLFNKYEKKLKKCDKKNLFLVYEKYGKKEFLLKLKKIFSFDFSDFFEISLEEFLYSDKIFAYKNEEKLAVLVIIFVFCFRGFVYEKNVILLLDQIFLKNYQKKNTLFLDKKGIDVCYFNKKEEYFFQIKMSYFKNKDIINFKSGVEKIKNKHKIQYGYFLVGEKIIKIF